MLKNFPKMFQIKIQNRIRIPFLVFLFAPLLGVSQKVFLSHLNDQDRVYLYSSTTTAPNQPLVILLDTNSSDLSKVLTSSEIWSAVPPEVNFVFPRSVDDAWECADSIKLYRDIAFINQMIADVHANFKINRNQVYLISSDQSTCTADAFKQAYPNQIAHSIGLQPDELTPEKISTEIEQLLSSDYQSKNSFALYKNPDFQSAFDPLDSLKKHSYNKRWILKLHSGGLYIIGSARKEISDRTYMDIANSHNFTGLELAKWMNDSLAWYVDVSRLNVPMKQDLSSYTVTTGGGTVISATGGLKYRLVRHYFFQPYVMVGTGSTLIFVAGGKIATNSTSVNFRDKIDSETRVTWQNTVGLGVDMRFGKRIVLGGLTQYLHSTKFKTAGSINAIRGFNFTFSAGYVLNANKEKHLHPK